MDGWSREQHALQRRCYSGRIPAVAFALALGSPVALPAGAGAFCAAGSVGAAVNVVAGFSEIGVGAGIAGA